MNPLSTAIRDEAAKLIQRHQRYASELEERVRRIERRTGARPPKVVLMPSHWKVHSGFNPYAVRVRANGIGYAISRAISRYDYRPRPAVSFDVPKDGSGLRSVSVFQVADNAVSRAVFHRLLTKNSSRLNAHSYAYRIDKTLHDAVLDIAAEFRGQRRLFVAEFDFRKYFDSISHEHIHRILHDQRFFVTPVESLVIRAFLEAPTFPQASYDVNSTARRERGIPQGTSISLFLANIAAHPLDNRLERLGVGFARFADDTLIWSDDYSLICRAADVLQEAAQDMGVDVNLGKSPGISILTPEEAKAEFKSKSEVEFLGYSISPDGIGIRQKNLGEIKEWIAYLIYVNLLEQPLKGNFVGVRVSPPIDRDYVVLLFQLRRYLYGDLSEKQLRRYLDRDTPRIHYRGLMSFYPILDDEGQLRDLDGWMLHTVRTTLRKRAVLFASAGFSTLPQPHGLTEAQLLQFVGTTSKGTKLDLRLPSFYRMAKLLRTASSIHGANAVSNKLSAYGLSATRRKLGYRWVF
jgi:hypothetical protein